MKPILPRLFLLLFICFAVAIFPLPDWATDYRPPLTLMFVLYVQCYLPAYFSLLALFMISLCLDALLFQVIGAHAFAMFLVTWLVNSKARRFHFFTIAQQLTLMSIFCCLYQFALLSVNFIFGFHCNWLQLVINPLLAILFWPWLKLLSEEWFQSNLKPLSY